MHAPITHQQAEQLLESTTPGKWEINPLSGNVASFGHGEIAGTLSCPSDRELIMTAPDLARTTMWLWEQNQQQQAQNERLRQALNHVYEGGHPMNSNFLLDGDL